jgi:hypothetical protein
MRGRSRSNSSIEAEPRNRSKPVPQLLAAKRRGSRHAGRDDRSAGRADSRGPRTLAGHLTLRDDAHDVAFVIGSADGLAESIKRDSRPSSLSAPTLPRRSACSSRSSSTRRLLLAGHPYHRE